MDNPTCRPIKITTAEDNDGLRTKTNYDPTPDKK